MDLLARKDLRGKWRERLFRAWVIASAVVAVYACLIGPITHYLGEGQALVALSVPLLMFFLLATGLGWLVLLFFSHPDEGAQAQR